MLRIIKSNHDIARPRKINKAKSRGDRTERNKIRLYKCSTISDTDLAGELLEKKRIQ